MSDTKAVMLGQRSDCSSLWHSHQCEPQTYADTAGALFAQEKKETGQSRSGFETARHPEPCSSVPSPVRQHVHWLQASVLQKYPGSFGKQIQGLHSSRAEAETFDVFLSPAGDSAEADPGTGF